MAHLIQYKELPEWVPGRILLSSDDLGWKNVALRSYHYQGQDVLVPAMSDFMIVGYQGGVTPMQRRLEGGWKKEVMSPGVASLLTRAQKALWNWHEPIDVTHIYLSSKLVMEVASEVMDGPVSSVTLADVLRTEDPMMNWALGAIAQEAHANGLGGSLYVDSIARALVIHLLRAYASISSRSAANRGALSAAQARMVREYIDTHIADTLDLPTLASSIGLDHAPCSFARHFRRYFGKPPHTYLIDRRLERARRLLAQSGLAIKDIATECGFSDQAHLTRLFRRTHGITPAAFRRQQQT